MKTLVELCSIGNEYIIINHETQKWYDFQGSYKKAMAYIERNNMITYDPHVNYQYRTNFKHN